MSVPLKWLKEPTNVKVSVGKSIKIACTAQGNPAPVIKWRRLNSNQLSEINKNAVGTYDSNQQYNVLSSFHLPELQFNSISNQDSGMYECSANNGNEDISKVIQVEVVGK